ncbi:MULTISPECIES: IS3 family transposase [Diaphorobacter]|uniref:IS3 family transposase n=1 Tax=Diaphorobacter TaxID=238749 RepID=UPI000CDAD161|nr:MULTISPECIES: IS3 family transposase [Diaphorobacter]QYY24519.1 IS3 family transposase [Diaphorobacter sp. MNS-0]QYY24581.1 IS3 family transposase [Diaphorobacter sp. MNS-0]QYY25090.1 IS3 family transposase [Diaphorobacter sp. MNS-0]QYY25091.1 IS3 family transposase [Diaphorobacter sp. MNS-0]QYY26486.1 IS3 family transposase [Diaphorobacter sp. MNS-0]
MSDKQVRAQYTREFKQEAVRQVRSGQAIAVVAKVLGIPKASLGNWVRLSAKGELDGAGGGDKGIQVSPEQMEIARLRAENARLRMERDIGKKSRGVLRAGHAARYAWIHQMRKLYPVSVSCGVLEVSASGYFNWLRRRESGHGGPARRHSDEALLAYMRAIHAEVKGEYGWPRMHKELLARGIRVGKDRVRKLMQQHGIRAKTKRKFVVTTDSRHSLPVAPDLVQRRFNPEAPNQLWSGDITYIQTDEGWLYLAAVIDLFNRQVVGWSLQPHMQASLVKDALAMAWWRRRPPPGLIFHSDRGSQYCSHEFQDALKGWGMRSSMSRKGNCWDNAPTESFWGRLKTASVHGCKFATREQARQAVMDWMAFYNHRRLHSSLGYLSPMQYEQRWYEAQRKKAA